MVPKVPDAFETSHVSEGGVSSGLRTLIVIPAYNEEASLPEVLRELATTVPKCDVLVVDDGSRDATSAVAHAGGVRVVTLPFNIGVGGALRAGFRYAVMHDFDRVIQVDGDGQHEPDDIKVLIAALDRGASLVIGSRFADPSSTYKVGGLRWGAMRLLRLVVRVMSGRRFTDTTSGFRAFDRALIERFSRELSSEYMADTVEALLRALAEGYVVVEVPVRMRPRSGGQASQSPLMLLYQYSRLLVVILSSASRRIGRNKEALPIPSRASEGGR